MVPLMNLVFKKSFTRSVSISSLAIVLISLFGWLQLGFTGNSIGTLTEFHWGYVDFGAAFPLASGGFLGALFNLKINRRYLQYAFSVLAIVMAVKLIVEVFDQKTLC